jgi:hypothetical protein
MGWLASIPYTDVGLGRQVKGSALERAKGGTLKVQTQKPGHMPTHYAFAKEQNTTENRTYDPYKTDVLCEHQA